MSLKEGFEPPIFGAVENKNGAGYQVKKAILDYLRSAIIRGEIAPGEKLHESKLVKQFGASRSPIREALVQLEAEGLVITYPKSGTVVTQITKGQLRQAFFVRSVLEKANIELLISNIRPDGIRKLRGNIEAQKIAFQTNDYLSIYSEMDNFHLFLCELNSLPHVWELIRKEKIALDRLHELNKPHQPRLEALFTQHIEIVDALEKKDRDLAVALIQQHADLDFEAMKLLEGFSTEGVEANSLSQSKVLTQEERSK
jgi:hypothetical protein